MSPTRKRKEVKDRDRSEEDSNDDSSEHGDQQHQQPHTSDRDNTLPQSSSVTAVTTSTMPSLPSLAEAAAAAAPAPTASRSTKKSRRAGFREQFLQQLRVMLDRESQMNSTIVQWSTDGNSFIVMDQNRFEGQTIPTYFDNRIIFASFLRKLNRWGFRRVTRSSHTHYEFVSPTFRRLGGESTAGTAVAEDDAPAPAHAAAASAAIGDAPSSDTNPSADTHQQLPVAPPPLPQVGTMQANHQTTTAQNDYLRSQQASQAADVITALLSNVMQRSNQQPSTTSQQSPTAANSILQGGNVDWSSIQRPSPTTNQLLSNAINIFSAQQQPPPQQLGASYHSHHHQGNPLSALMSLVGTFSTQPASTNTSTTSTSELVQLLLMLLHQLGEDDRQRRAQADAIQSTLVSIIAMIISGQQGQMANEYDSHRRISDLLGIVGRANNRDSLQNQEHASTSNSAPANLNVQTPRRDEAETQIGGGSRREFPNDDGDSSNSQYDADSDNDEINE